MRPMTKFGLLPLLSTDLESGLDQAKTQNKPLMLVIHKTWCGACKRLKPQFESSKDIAELSEKFIMVNAQDDEEPKGQEFAPDGGYVYCVYLRSDHRHIITIVIICLWECLTAYKPTADGFRECNNFISSCQESLHLIILHVHDLSASLLNLLYLLSFTLFQSGL